MNNLNNTVEEVRARMDIVDIISEHVALKKSGKNWMGLCPFHPEKTPSFTVNSEKNMFKCFGCGAGGDGFSFLQRITNQPFAQILADLAAKYGIKINYSNENTDLKNQILEVNKLTAKYYTENLFNTNIGGKAREYLNNRGINDEIIFQFNLGYAPEGWDNLINHLSSKHGISRELMDKAGLITQKQQSDSYYDRFRDRVIIPIHNDRGQIIAFGGRLLGKSENQPKYLNSPDTPVFNKGKNLYALYHAKDSIRIEDSVILMEGYFDAISAHANGITNVVATLGTALTSDQLRILGKYTESKRIFIAFDADLAGGSATSRGIEVIKNTFGGLGGVKILNNSFSKNTVYEIRVISVPDGKDPDEFIRNKGAEIFKRLIKNAPLLLDFQIEQILNSSDLETATGKLKAVKQLTDILAEISSPIIRSEYIKSISDRINVREEDLLSELSQLKLSGTGNKLSNKRSDTHGITRREPKEIILTAERNLISIYFLKEEFWKLANKTLKEVNLSEVNHQLIKSLIEELIQEINTIDELTQKLLTRLADNPNAMEVLSGIIFSLEDKQCMDNENSISLFVKENLACISRFKAQNQEQEIKEKYYAAKDDEIKALEVQYEVRNIVNSRLAAL